MKCLLDDPDFEPGGEELVCGNAAPLQREAGALVGSKAYLCEAAGRAFAERYELTKSEREDGDEEDSDDDDDDMGDAKGRDKGGKDKPSGDLLKLSDALKDVNLYELIGCSEGASQDDIKKAYRSLVLTAHPDKMNTTNEEEKQKAQERFVMIQEAYEIISDPAKRMQYDSHLDFDDSLPRFKTGGGEDFFEVFSPVFRRNARWSHKKPVPDLGGPDTPAKEWKRFYDFWYEFQSWRDPLVMAQKDGEELCDLAEAECREEKRWMMRENARVAKKYKQAEKDRIMDLVRMAEKFDPRVTAEKDAKKAARQAEAERKNAEKLAAQKAKEEADRQRREAEEAAKAAEAAKRQKEKAAREAAKAEVKKCRQRVRAFHHSVKDLVVLDQLNEVLLQFEEAKLRKLGDEVECALKKKDGAAAAGALLHSAIESIGLKPLTPTNPEDASTSSGPSQSDQEETPEAAAERQRREAQAEVKRRKAEEERKKREAKEAEERARREAERAEEKRRNDEIRRVEQQKAEAKRRQQEKKEEEKAKKAEEKKKKEEEQEVQRREQQREEAKQRAKEQAEKDKQEAIARQSEMESERVAKVFEMDRIDRLSILDKQSDEDMLGSLRTAYDEDASLRGALGLLKKNADNSDPATLDRAMALVHNVSDIWPLGLMPPAGIKLAPAVRNRAKKARSRLQDHVITFYNSIAADGSQADVTTEWQRGIIDGSLPLPVWSIEAKEAADKAVAEAKAVEVGAAEEAGAGAGATGKKSKKAKAKQEPKAEEDLDELLAEFGVSPTESKKKPKKKK